MTPEQKNLVQTSFEKVKPIAETAATLFYGCLFNLDPNLERLFKGDLHDQGRKLMHMIGLAVKGLNRLDELVPLLHQLGARHAGYGVTERDYETVGDALLWALGLGLGDEFTPAVKDAWIAVYELLADTMRAGASEALLVSATPMSNEATTSTGGERNGWREYFPAAASKTLKRRETEMKSDDNYEPCTGRLVTTLITLVCALFLFAAAARANTYTVNSPADDDGNTCPDANGNCTLRQAISTANQHAGNDTINFNIAFAPGVVTITPGTPLPTITDSVVIDGYTQRPCASNQAPCSKQNTLAQGDNALLLIELNGSADSSDNATILSIAAPNCTIRGLVLNRSGAYGIYVSSGGSASITGNFIGTDATGTFAQANGDSGIFIWDSSGNVIGGTSPSARNVISGNTYPIHGGSAIRLYGSSASTNKIWGNFIGTNKNGTGTIGNNQTGVFIDNDAHDNTVGGTTIGARNIISGNAGPGVVLDDSSFNTIEGNFIGTDVTGSFAVANSYGVTLAGNAGFNKIGDTVAGAGNVISANTWAGVYLSAFTIGAGPTGNRIYGNFIGTQANGTSALGNGTNGVELDHQAQFNAIGDDLAGAGNVIAFNGTDPVHGADAGGVYLWNDAGTGNIIRGNSIYSNHALGIDLRSKATTGTEVTPNDLNDADTGPNKLQNFPVLTSAVISNGITTITGTLNSENIKSYIISFYGSPDCDASGYGEGRTYLGKKQVSTSGNNASFSVGFSVVAIQLFVTATATDQDGNTSEFSQCRQVTVPVQAGSLAFSAPAYSIGEGGGLATVTATRTSGSDGAVSVHYQTGGGTATANSDYTPASGMLNWADGDTGNKTFTIPITNDDLDEPDETVGLTLSSSAGGATLGNQSTATLTITDNDPPVALSISNTTQAEGNSGTTSFVFSVTTGNSSGQTVTVSYATVGGGTATLGNDYQQASGTLTFLPGELSKTVTVLVNGDTTIEPDETFFVQLSNPTNATLGKASGTGTIINDDAPAGPTFGFSQANYTVPEQLGAVAVTVTRSGDTSGSASVDYTTVEGAATQKSDYEIAAGTLNFAPGEASKSVQILINQDMYIEGNETFSVLLSNPSGAALGQPSAPVTITDDVPESATNPIDDPQSFVYMHYHDFLNREPDQAGLQFWTNNLTSCGQDATCVAAHKVDVSAAYFLSIEFQQTGFLLHLMQKESFGALPKYANFMRDLQEVSQGVIVNSPGWEQKLAANQQQFAQAWVNRSGFKAAYDGMSNAAYVNALYANAGVVPPQAEHDGLVTALDTATQTRASVLLEVTANAAFRQQEQNSAFVLMQYFGYLRRDPDSGPDSDLSGYFFWLQKLNSFNGDYQQAEMVKAFLDSLEYRGRFGQ